MDEMESWQMRVEPQITALPPPPSGDDVPISRALTFGGGGISAKAKWRIKNKKRIKAQLRAYYLANKAKLNKANRARYEHNKEQIKERNRQTRPWLGQKRNPVKEKAWRSARLERHKIEGTYDKWKESTRLSKAETYKNNRAYYKAQMRAYYLKNKANLMAHNREWAARNREKIRAMGQRYYLINKARIDAHNRLAVEANPEKKRKSDRAYHLKRCSNLLDGYVRMRLSEGTLVPSRAWPAQLVEAKRIEMKIKRKLKELCQNQ